MICITKYNIDQRFEELKSEILARLEDEKELYIDILDKKQYKSRKQNNTFHSLLDCFWNSGCSSFAEKNYMRHYYKKAVGLVDMLFEDNNLTEETRQMVWKAIKILPLETTQRIEVINLLKGRIECERSWGIATKKQAREAIDMILHDMDESGVITSSQGKKYEEILGGMNADNWWNRSTE